MRLALLLSSHGDGHEDALPAALRDGSAFVRACRSMDGGRRALGAAADAAQPLSSLKLGGALDARALQRSMLDDLMAPMMSRSISDALQEG